MSVTSRSDSEFARLLYVWATPLARRISSRRDERLDLVQVMVEAAGRKRHHFDPSRSTEGAFYRRLMWNAAIDEKRRWRRQSADALPSGDEVAELRLPSRDDPHLELALKCFFESARRAHPRALEALALKLYGRTANEIDAALGPGSDKAAQRLRALARKALAPTSEVGDGRAA